MSETVRERFDANDLYKYAVEVSVRTTNTLNMCHDLAYAGGWWTNIETDEPKELTVDFILSKLMLICTEIAEAAEGARKGLMDDHLPERTMLEVELADAIIRIGDLGGALNLDIGGAIIEKLKYNQERADHKIENRKKEGGKVS